MLFDRIPVGLPKDTQVLEVVFRRRPVQDEPIPRPDTYETARVKRVLRGPQLGSSIVVRIPGVCHLYPTRISGLLVGRMVADPRAPGGRAFVTYEVREPVRSGRSRLVDERFRAVGLVALPSQQRLDVLRRPTTAELRALYPPPALARQRFGQGEVTCSVGWNGRPYDCAVVDEAPEKAGFGKAALHAAAIYRFHPRSRRGTVDPSVVITVQFGEPSMLRVFP